MDQDPQLKQLIEGQLTSLSLEEKYQILTTYMQGGIQALIDDSDAPGDIAPGDEAIVEEEFNKIYKADPKLQELLGASLSSLSFAEKYQILIAYNKGGGIQGLLGEEGAEGEDEDSFVEFNGKKFKKVQIEGENQEYYMDEEGNIYDGQFNYVGQANGSDEEGEGEI